MGDRDLVRALEAMDPDNDVLAILSNARAGYYAGVPDEDLARDLAGLKFNGPEADASAWAEGMAELLADVRDGAFRAGQEAIGSRSAEPDEAEPDEADESLVSGKLGSGRSPAGLSWPPAANPAVPDEAEPATNPAPPVSG